jgi:hypothetical protein
MAKLSVSVGDELWEQAKRLHPDLGTSELIQTAIRQFVRHSSPSSQALDLGMVLPRPPDAASLRDAALQRLRATMATSYQDGYRDALGCVRAGTLGWADLNLIAEFGWDLMAWTGYDQSERLNDPVYSNGFLEALKDLRQASLDELFPEPDADASVPSQEQGGSVALEALHDVLGQPQEAQVEQDG